jgi:hypothetical protein
MLGACACACSNELHDLYFSPNTIERSTLGDGKEMAEYGKYENVQDCTQF